MTFPTTTGDEKRLKQLASLLVDIYEACPRNASPRNFAEACLATAYVVGEGPEQRKTEEIEEELSPSTRREVALTKIGDKKGSFVSELEHYQDASGRLRSKTPRFETGAVPVEAAGLCEGLGIGFDEAADAVAEAKEEGPPAGTPLPQDEVFEPRLTKKLFSRSRDVTPASPTDKPDDDSQSARGASEAGSDRPRAADGDDPKDASGTNGFDNTPADIPEEPESEDSDRDSGVDVSAVNPQVEPPVEARCNRDQWRWLTSRTKTVSEQWLFLYLEHCDRQASYGGGDDRWVVVECEKLHEKFGVPYPTEKVWQESGLIESREDGRYISPEEAEERGVEPQARKFRVKQEALGEWTRIGVKGPAYRYKAHRRELVRTSPPAAMTTDTMDGNDNRYPWLIDRAVRILKEAEHEIILDAIEEAEEKIAKQEGAEGRASLTSLRLAKETAKRQVIQVQDGVAQLQNAYEVQEISGRLGFKRGGPQGLLGEVKARAYDIDGLRNFDIRECHSSALRQVAKKLETVGVHIDISPWEEYPGKYAVAAETGLPVSLIKIVEHAVKYGAVIPLSVSQAEDYFEEVCGYKISIAEEVKKHAEKGLIEDPDEALRTLYDVFESMREVVKRMAKALLDDYYHAKRRGGYMHNACGISFLPSAHAEGHDREAAVMAWMLQGLEAAFIHSLTILGARSDEFSVIANEHDGCIVKGEIPQEAIEVARHMSGFHEAELVEKAFADEEDVEALYAGEQEQQEPNGPESASDGVEEQTNSRPRRHPGMRRRRTSDDEKTEAEKAAEEAQRDLSDFHRRGGPRERRGLPTADTGA